MFSKLRTLSRFGLAVGLSSLLLTSHQLSAASPWFTDAPTLESTGKSISPSEYTELRSNRQGITAGQECINKRIARRAFGTLSIQYENTCWYQTKLGLLSTAGNYLLQTGTQVAGHIGTSSPSQPILRPTPNPEVFLELTPAAAVGNGYYLAFRTLDNSAITRSQHPTGTVTLTFQNPANSLPLQANGSRFFIESKYIHWSEDGRYMLVWSERGVLYRFDLETFKAQTAKITDYSGTLLTGSAALSPSGNIAAVAYERTGAFANLYLVDFTGCNVAESANLPAVPATCPLTQLRAQLQTGIQNFVAPLLPRFYGEHTLSFYNRPGATTGNYDQYVLQAAGTDRNQRHYLALGDSFSSGEGAGNYIDGTDVKGVNMCHTSKNSYPYLINKSLNFDSFSSVACSGAVIDNFNEDIQWAETLEILKKDLPGGYLQKEYVETNNIYTITMSGNDIGFGSRLEYCIVWSANCYNSYEERKEIADEIQSQHSRLVDMYKDILGTLPGQRKLYVLGYPQIMSSEQDAQCGLNVFFNPYQREMANDLITYFNSVIKSAAAHAGAYYVGTESSLDGHKLCEGPSATMAVNGLTFGDESGISDVGPLGIASFHPNELGHQLMGAAVRTKTSNLSAPMPTANPTLLMPDPEQYAFLDMPKSGGVVHKLRYNKFMDNAMLKRGTSGIVKLTDPLNPFAPNSLVTAILKSETTVLGTIKANPLGYLDGTLSIPASIAPGVHELRLNGTSDTGTPLSVRQFVFVYAEQEDYDGDGTPNNEEPCVMFDASGVDQDKDGVDDRCDPVIGNPPIEPVTPDTPSQSTTSTPTTTNYPTNSSPSPSPQLLGVTSYTPQQTLSVTSDTPSTVEAPQVNEQPKEQFASLVDTPKQSSNSWILLAGGITLVVILGYSVVNYAYLNKK